jgi:hypothetical protein
LRDIGELRNADEASVHSISAWLFASSSEPPFLFSLAIDLSLENVS